MSDKIKLQHHLQQVQEKYARLGSIDGVSQYMKISSTDFALLEQRYVALLRDFGVEVVYSPFTHLNQAYGGPHCLTQVLKRGV
jgi:arginine deiminase